MWGRRIATVTAVVCALVFASWVVVGCGGEEPAERSPRRSARKPAPAPGARPKRPPQAGPEEPRETEKPRETPPQESFKNIMDTARDEIELGRWVRAAEVSGLGETLSGEEPFTVLAPSDSAFEQLGGDTLDRLMSDRYRLKRVMRYHLVPGRLSADELVKVGRVKTFSGEMLEVARTRDGVTVNGVPVRRADIPCANGVIHMIDGVLSPPSAAVETGPKDIVQALKAAGTFHTFLKALEASGLVEVLAGPGPYTVFAPSDEALRDAPPEIIETLISPEDRAEAQRVLKYHVVAGRLSLAEIRGKKEAQTLQGGKLRFALDGNEVRVNDGTIIQPDVKCTNGVIQVIDRLLVPRRK